MIEKRRRVSARRIAIAEEKKEKDATNVEGFRAGRNPARVAGGWRIRARGFAL